MNPLTTPLRRATRSLGLVTAGVLSTLGALSLAHLGPAQAVSPGVPLAALVAQVSTLKTQQAADEAQIALLQGTPVPGPKGDKGNAGTPGTNGSPGANGVNGSPGTPGLKGDTGQRVTRAVSAPPGRRAVPARTGSTARPGLRRSRSVGRR